MSRALLILGVGVLLTFAAAMMLTPGALIAAEGFMFVLLTVLAGTVVIAVVAWRARIRDRARALEDHDLRHDAGDPHNPHDDGPARPTTAPVTPGEETDRG